jgi:ubiquinol-cytochrome c reductase cytochrome c1 subunit
MAWIFQKESTLIRKNTVYFSYFDHMIIGMPRQLYDGLVEFEDGTPASTPQMANDVANFITFTQRRSGHSYPDKQIRKWMFFVGAMLLMPFRYVKTYGYYRALLSTRT